MPPYSGSLNFNLSIIGETLTTADDLEFRLISEYQPLSGNFTASISPGSLTVQLQSTAFGQLPFASSIGSFGNFIEDITANSIILNESLSSFYGAYQQVPNFLSGSEGTEVFVTSSLYSQYGEISYPFEINFGDRIVLIGDDGRSQILTALSVIVVDEDNLTINVAETIFAPWQIDHFKVAKFLLVKKVQDEQNIILQFRKSPGATSYGFVISDDVDPNLLANISTIQTNVQNQLLSTQENTG